MALFQRGSQGPKVAKIQTPLRELRLHVGPTDGNFGDGTESAVKAFQKANGLGVDRCVPNHKKEVCRGRGCPLIWKPAAAVSTRVDRQLGRTVYRCMPSSSSLQARAVLSLRYVD